MNTIYNTNVLKYIFYSIIAVFIYCLVDLLLYIFYSHFTKNKSIYKNNLLNNYYELFKHCKFYSSSRTELHPHFLLLTLFSLYYFFILLSIIIIVYILKYNVIISTKKYNCLYLINAFICCTVFYLYYGSYFYKKVPKLDVLIDKHLTPKEKEIYKKTWG